MKDKTPVEFLPLNIAVLTVSDHRTPETDSSGDALVGWLTAAGHHLQSRAIVRDCRYALRAEVSARIADAGTQVVLINGGTGFGAGNETVAAIAVLFDKPVEGYGEAFRQLSFADIGSAAMQSRALAGLANGCLIAAMPGSPSACELAWSQLLQPQLDARTRPCNFVNHLKGGKRRCLP